MPAGAFLRAVFLRRAGDTKWYGLTEPVPDGPTTTRMQKLAKKYGMVMVVPVYEAEMTGVYFNTAAVFDADGKYLGKYRKTPHSALPSGILGEILFHARQLGLSRYSIRAIGTRRRLHLLRPPFPRRRAHSGPERRGDRVQSVRDGRRAFANICGSSSSRRTPSPTAISSARINRVGTEKPWQIGEFYGKSYFCNPRGKIIAQASRDKDELLVADLNLDEIEEVREDLAVLPRPPPGNLRRDHAHASVRQRAGRGLRT